MTTRGSGDLRPARAIDALVRLALLAVAAFGPAAGAQPVGVATWNLGWLLDAGTHAQWVAACSRHGWPTQTDHLPAAERARLAALPFCNVHNGMLFPPDRCNSTRDDWPRAARYPADHPCRETADLASWSRYEDKVAALRAMLHRLEQQGVAVVALQEVAGAAAIRPLLPSGWRVATTRELPGTPAIAQHVGIAWRADVRVRDIAAVLALADGGVPQRPLRPGLAFTLDVAGKPVRVLVVHLKAGCRNRELDAPLTARDANLPAERQDAIASDCAMLRFQLPALEAWIDAQAGQDFALLGDFNRALLREPVADSPSHRTRLDGSEPRDPVGPCTMTRSGARWIARCPARTRALFPELNDGHPAGAVLWRARFADLPKGGAIRAGSTGDCRLVGQHGDLMHDGVDHVLVSASLKRRLTAQALTLRVVNYQDADGNALRATAALALPSDHCPHVVQWSGRP